MAKKRRVCARACAIAEMARRLELTTNRGNPVRQARYSGATMVYGWSTHGVRIVYGWRTDIVRMLYGYCTYRVRMVYD
jgi:hypothetical protein